jgi:hypothetical protein
MLSNNKDDFGLTGIPSPLDFSALDYLLFPGITSDILVAERLEHLAYFTSTRGMATFTDRDSFLNRQRMATEAYEEKVKLENMCKTEADSVDPLQAKAHELVDNLRAVIGNKIYGDAITNEWSRILQDPYLDFFSPPNIRRYLEFFWSLWYPHCPIVHKPLFDATSISPALICVMVVIGACLSPNDQEHETARFWLDSCEELVFSHKCFRSDGAVSNDEVERREKIQCMQATYLVCSLQKREGSLEAQARIRRYRHASMVAVS